MKSFRQFPEHILFVDVFTCSVNGMSHLDYAIGYHKCSKRKGLERWGHHW